MRMDAQARQHNHRRAKPEKLFGVAGECSWTKGLTSSLTTAAQLTDIGCDLATRCSEAHSEITFFSDAKRHLFMADTELQERFKGIGLAEPTAKYA